MTNSITSRQLLNLQRLPYGINAINALKAIKAAASKVVMASHKKTSNSKLQTPNFFTNFAL